MQSQEVSACLSNDQQLISVSRNTQQRTAHVHGAKKPEKMARGVSDSAIVRAAIRKGEPRTPAT